MLFIMITRYIIYGLTGLVLEIFWTGLGSLLVGDYALTGHTYIWMFFIYGMGVFLESIHNKIRDYHILLRGFAWIIVIYIIEFSSGFVLDLLIGYCPWDYRNSTNLTLFGYIRFDYAIVWFSVGLLFEKYHDFLKRVTVQ